MSLIAAVMVGPVPRLFVEVAQTTAYSLVVAGVTLIVKVIGETVFSVSPVLALLSKLSVALTEELLCDAEVNEKALVVPLTGIQEIIPDGFSVPTAKNSPEVTILLPTTTNTVVLLF